MKYRIEMQPLAGRTVVACKDPQTGEIIRALALNASAAEMLRLRLEGQEVPQIARILSEHYVVDPARIAVDAAAFFEKFAL